MPSSVQRGYWGAQCALVETLDQKYASVKVPGALYVLVKTVGGGGGAMRLSEVFWEHE